MARYIDADKLCDSLRESYNRLFELYKKAKDNDAATICEAELNTFMECIIRAKTQPTADVVEVKHGEWKRNERNIPKMREFHEKGIALSMSEKSIFYTCSCCGSWGTLTQNYCPNCGAKMDGGNAE